MAVSRSSAHASNMPSGSDPHYTLVPVSHSHWVTLSSDPPATALTTLRCLTVNLLNQQDVNQRARGGLSALAVGWFLKVIPPYYNPLSLKDPCGSPSRSVVG
jgi:hypothetical protein